MFENFLYYLFYKHNLYYFIMNSLLIMYGQPQSNGPMNDPNKCWVMLLSEFII